MLEFLIDKLLGISLALSILVVAIIFMRVRKIYTHERIYRFLAFMIGLSLFLNLIARIYAGTSIYKLVPFSLGNICAIFMIYALYYTSYNAIKVTYFIGVSVLLTLVTPDFSGNDIIGSVTYFTYYIKNTYIITGLLMCLYNEKINISLIDLRSAILVLYAIILNALLYNTIFSTNILLVSRQSEYDNLLNFLGVGYTYNINYFIFSTLLLVLLYLIYCLFTRQKIIRFE